MPNKEAGEIVRVHQWRAHALLRSLSPPDMSERYEGSCTEELWCKECVRKADEETK